MGWTEPRDWVVDEVVTAPELNTHIRDNLLQALGPAATTIAELNTAWGGTPPDGAPGRLRLGTTPFVFLDLVYDATLAKWVELVPSVCTWGDKEISHNTSVTTVRSEWNHLRRDYALGVAAGLKLQVRATALARNNNGSHGSFWIEAAGADEGETPQSMASVFAARRTPLSGELSSSDWQVIDSFDEGETEWTDVATTWDAKKVLLGRFAMQSNASPDFTTTRYRDLRIESRWVSA